MMRNLAAMAALCLVIVLSGKTEAGTIYVNPAGSSFTLTLTTDGTIGFYNDASHILSWSVSGDPGLIPVTSDDAGAKVTVSGLVVTTSALSLTTPGSGQPAALLRLESDMGFVVWEAFFDSNFGVYLVTTEYFQFQSPGVQLGAKSGLASTSPFTDVLAVAAVTAVPEPSGLTLAGLGIVSLAGCGLRRRVARVVPNP